MRRGWLGGRRWRGGRLGGGDEEGGDQGFHGLFGEEVGGEMGGEMVGQMGGGNVDEISVGIEALGPSMK